MKYTKSVLASCFLTLLILVAGCSGGSSGSNDAAVDLDADGFTVAQGDCNDTDAAINPGATEIPGNAVDENCDGTIAPAPTVGDTDGDGFSVAQGDCDDNNSAINPGAVSIPDNGIDENCDGQDPVTPASLAVRILTPSSLVTVGNAQVDITGSLDDTSADLTINGVAVSPDNLGNFTARVSLAEGHNSIVARVIKGTQQATDSISVSLDVTPPFVTIESHLDGQNVYSDSITVTGLINDIVRGTIEQEQATVTINGIDATISNRSYSAAGISLAEGANIITVSGVDQVGNVGTVSITVNYVVPTGRRLEQVSGQSQTAIINSVLAEPLRVRVLDDSLAPVDNASVVFRVIQGAGAVGATTSGEGRAVIVDTDINGEAQTQFRIGERVGASNQRVRAKVVGYDDEIVFNASATGNVGNKINVNSGNNQRGAVGQVLSEAFVVSVTDSGANVVKSARVRFTVTKGQGLLSGSGSTDFTSSFETVTDSDGRATAEYKLGFLAGIDAQRVTATLLDAPLDSDGNPLLLTSGFTASAFVPGDAGSTSISGVVLDNQDKAIPGVTVRVDGTTRQSLTDDQGRFVISSVPVGPVRVVADGSTATVAGEFPSLTYNIVTIAGVDNPLAAPIYMVKLDTDGAVQAGLVDVELTLSAYPGFKLEIKKDSVTFPDGSRQGLISVTPVNSSKVPMAPPNGMQPQFIVTIQPTGTRFDPPARLTLPNVDGHKSGAQVEMYSFDHDLEEFVAIGLGTVSEDATVVASNLGVGVIKAGWHCGSQPGGQGCGHNCPVCQDCDGNCNCIAAANDPRLTDCQSCKDGKVDEPTPESCCKAQPATDGFATAGGLVVCCKGVPTSCVAPGGDGSTGSGIIDKCIAEHEDAHHTHIECPQGDDKCTTSRPPFKDSQDPGDGECDASKVEIACLNREKPNCGGDAACESRLNNRITQMVGYANGNKPGCI